MPGLARAVAVLRSGGLVAFPTETVYGLGADASNAAAVDRVFRVKGRPTNHPLIVHLADAADMSLWARDVPQLARDLAVAFWPGPLTLILKRSARVPDAVTGGADTVGLRVPSHPVAQALLRAFSGAIAAPSANRFGAVSPTRAEHVCADLGDDVDIILDGGECDVGVESTIVNLTGDTPTILRPGGVTAEQLSAVLKCSVQFLGASEIAVPGQLPSHYAPRARVEIVARSEVDERLVDARAKGFRAASIISDAVPLEDLARQLYTQLRGHDADGCDVIFVTLPSDTGLGLAIADRLRKAAGPRR